MKILYVSSVELDVQGGPRTHTLEILEAWHKLGHDIILLVPSFNQKKLKFPFKVIVYPFFGFSFLRLILSYFLQMFFLVWSLSKHRITVIYTRQMAYNPSISIFSRIFRCPLIVEINGLMTQDLNETGSGKVPIAIHKLIERKEFDLSTGLVCTSPVLVEKIMERHSNLRGKISFIPNGVNHKLFFPMNKQECRKKIDLYPKKKYVGNISTFNHLHESESIIESFNKIAEKVPDVSLLMVGDGPKKKICEQLVSDLKLTDKVIFSGLLNYEDIPIYINSFDVNVVFASKMRLEREGVVAFKFIESLACGCPTVAQYLNPIDKDFFSPFVEMVNFGDKLALSDSVIDLLSNPEKCSWMTKGSVDYIKHNVSWGRSASKTIEFIDKRINRG